MSRQEFSKAVKLAAFQRSKGHCEKCTAKLFAGNTEYHHAQEDTFGGQPTVDNCLVLCRACHRAITNERAAAIAKSNRVRAAHIGHRKPRTIRAWRKFSGEIVYASRER